MRKALARYAMLWWLTRKHPITTWIHRVTWMLAFPTTTQRREINDTMQNALVQYQKGYITLDALVDCTLAVVT